MHSASTPPLLARACLALALATAACARAHAPRPPDAPRASSVPASPRAPHADATFASVSDTHFGYGGMDERNAAAIDAMLALPGAAYPDAIGGRVAPIDAVLVAGDLTEWGRPDEWAKFAAAYGLSRSDGARLRVPVLEVMGNHDRVPGPWMEARIAERHGGRRYAVTAGGVRVVALDEGPDDEGLALLDRELGALAPGTPALLLLHFPLEGPFSDDNWFGRGTFRERFGEALEGRDVVAIVHGHDHATRHYRWRGVDVLQPGAIKEGTPDLTLIHVTSERVTFAVYDYLAKMWRDSWSTPRARSAAARFPCAL